MRNMSEAETKVRIAKRVAEMLPDGGFVNLGVGIPTMAVDYLPANKHIYIQHSDADKQWRQSELLAAELYKNFRCMEGGYTKFLQDKTALLIYDKEKVKNIPISNTHLEIYKKGRLAVIQNVNE